MVQAKVVPAKSNLVDLTTLWHVHGKCYDLSNFVDTHPGGRLFILSGQGRDCSELFESYHALGIEKARAVLNKYYVCDLPNYTAHYSFEKNGFYDVLRTQVRDYFRSRNLSHKATSAVTLKFIILTLAYLMSAYMTIVYGNPFFALFTGFLHTMLGLNNIHDGSHSSFSNSPILNRVCSLHMNLIGGSDIGWLVHHVVGHHAHTRVDGKDPDASNFYPLLRQAFDMVRARFHQWQHIYCWFLTYPLVAIGITHTQVRALFEGYYYFKDLHFGPLITPNELYLASATKVITEVIYFLLPFYFQRWYVALMCIFIWWASSGIFFSFAFAVNHQVKEVLDLEEKEKERLKKEAKKGATQKIEDWGKMQVVTSANHSVGWRLMTLWVGGINLQIEHHLFPAVSPAHYSDLAPIVQKTCAQFGLPYVQFDNWYGALNSHYHYLKELSLDKQKSH